METSAAERLVVLVDIDLSEIVPPYIASRRGDLAALEIALRAGDLAQARELGHQLKGSGTSFGLEDVTRMGAALESAAKRSDLESARAITHSLSAYLGSVEVVFR